MSTDVLPSEPTLIPTGDISVALAGNPNVGKTTLFNALTGLKQKVANYPGVTVEKKVGRCELPTPHKPAPVQAFVHASIIDLPGTYSLASRSPDEHIAKQVLLGQIADTPRPDVIIVVCDASNLERNLYLVTQVLELGRPTVVALSMMDVAEEQGHPVNAEKLAMHLRTPVIPVQAHKGLGIDQLKRTVLQVANRSANRLDLPLPDVMTQHVNRLTKILQDEKLAPLDMASFDAHLILSSGEDEDQPDPRRQHPKLRPALTAAIEEMTKAEIDPIAAEIETHYAYINSIVADCVINTNTAEKGGLTSATDHIDRILTHKFVGMAIFVAIMGFVFVSIFTFAQPVMDFLQNTVVGGLGTLIQNKMPDGPLRDLIVSGIITGVGNVVVFLPQIAILFLFLAILEDSGYMSRAAFLMDRVMSKVGLHGKSFIPLLSGYACAVPAIMGTRVIENRRDRLATILILPLMSCSARLPVYSLLIGMFFAGSVWMKGGVMLAMYLLGTVTAFAMAWIFKRTLLKGPAPAFILEMPPYRLPHWRTVLTTVMQRSWQFLKRAGTIIFAFSILMWAATNYPKPSHYSQDYDGQVNELNQAKRAYEIQSDRDPSNLNMHNGISANKYAVTSAAEADQKLDQVTAQISDLQNARASEILEHSVAGHVGHTIAPLFYPLGFDWKASIGVTGAFFAREVIISTMGIIYSVGGDEESINALKDKMKADTWPNDPARFGSRAGTPIWTPLVALAMMVFVVYCMQCLSTLAITRRETNSLKYPIFMFIYMTSMAYVAALVVYQGGKALGF